MIGRFDRIRIRLAAEGKTQNKGNKSLASSNSRGIRASILFFFTFLFLSSSPVQNAEKPEVIDQVVFLYYSNFEEAVKFYESVMDFKQIEQTVPLKWVSIYRATGNSFVGIVDETKGTLKAAREKPVMLSWVSNDVNAWYQYLKGKGVSIIRAPKTNQETGIRAMLVKDPGGYMLEFFRWIK